MAKTAAFYITEKNFRKYGQKLQENKVISFGNKANVANSGSLRANKAMKLGPVCFFSILKLVVQEKQVRKHVNSTG